MTEIPISKFIFYLAWMFFAGWLYGRDMYKK